MANFVSPFEKWGRQGVASDPHDTTLYHKWDVKTDFVYVLQFFSLISDSLGSSVYLDSLKFDTSSKDIQFNSQLTQIRLNKYQRR